MKKVVDTFYGIIISFVIPVVGLLITKSIENEIAVIFSIILIPFIGIYFLKSKNKQLGIGIFLGLVPIVIFTLMIAEISKLH